MKLLAPAGAKILLIGEIPTEEDLRVGAPFTGHAGRELDTMLADTELSRANVALTYLFKERPPGGDINALAVPRTKLSLDLSLPWAGIPCKKGVVDPARTQPALVRLFEEIAQVNPNVIVTCGNAAVAALCGVSGITKLRGALHFHGQRKVIPTYSPAAVLRQYEWRPQVVADLIKAKIESAYPEARLINRLIYIEPTIRDLEDWTERLCNEDFISFDIETSAKQITCIGFAPNLKECFVIPFWDVKTGNYWEREEDEVLAYKAMRSICASRSVKIAQNGLYDVSYLSKYNVKVTNFTEDTMIQSHSLYPAMPKGLDFLGSIYANERAWKRWRVRGGDTNEHKREE